MSAAQLSSRPWYREPWPWLLMLPPALSVAGGVAMLALAVGEPAQLAVSDYGRIEELTAERFERDARAASLDVRADAVFTTAADGRTSVEVHLTGAHGAAPALYLRLQHVARVDADREIVLHRDAADVFRGVTELAAGRYDIELSPADRSWRLGGLLLSTPAKLDLRAAHGGGR